MTLNPSRSNISRFAGCTLTGALSVTTQVQGSITIVHGPNGCTHHNFSLLHTTGLDNNCATIPELVSTALSESDIIYGGEGALDKTLDEVAKRSVRTIFVLSTCIADAIGDDVTAICRKDRGVTVIPVPTAGFLGGTFQNGVNNALNAIAETAEPCTKGRGVNIIGEKNLEYEVEENFREVCRLLTALGISVNLRFVRNCPISDLALLGAARLNILRDPDLAPVGDHLQQRFSTPYISSYPYGLAGTLDFLEMIARNFNVRFSGAVSAEKALQEEVLSEFKDIFGSCVSIDPAQVSSESYRIAVHVAGQMDISLDPGGCRVPLEVSPPVGTKGILRMLHRWRRAIRAFV